MEKEFEELTNKLENMHTLVQSNDLSNENVNKIYNYSTELQIHNERLSQMLAELPIVEFSAPQVLELCNTDNKVELVAIDQESVLNQNFLIHFLSFIDISDLLMTIKYILMKKINGIVASIKIEHPNLNSPLHNMNNVTGNINFFNDVNSKMNIFRELYSLGVYQTTLHENLVDCLKKRMNAVVTTDNNNNMSILFIIPLLHNFKSELNACQALVIVPTRELAVYVKQVIENIKNFLGLDIQLARRDNNNLFDVPQFEVGLPDELHLKMIHGSIRRDFIKTVIVISPNEMLPNVELICQGIIRSLQRDRHITLILSDKIDSGLINRYNKSLAMSMAICLPNPYEVQNVFLSLPQQFYFSTKSEFKVYLFSDINSWFGDGRFIVFCNSLSKARDLCSLLYDLKLTLFHMDMDVKQRNLILKSFSSNNIRMLFTLDSINVDEFQLADCIIYYDFPTNPISYLNTITQFKSKLVVNFVNQHDLNTKKIIETICKSSMIPWPTQTTKYV